MPEEKHPELFRIICELAPKILGIQLGLGMILGGPVILGRCCGDGWGLLSGILSIALWIYIGKKFWFYSTIRWVWLLLLAWQIVFAIIELIRAFR
jgi:hypothetical protein